jgi:NAD(P)H-flavin reductase
MDLWLRAKVVRVEQTADDMRSLFVVPERPQTYKAGQNYELRVIGGEGARMYTVVTPPGRSTELEFGIQLVPGGLVSPKLYELKAGDELEMRGPHGKLFVWEPSPDPLVLIGGGAGMAALIPIYEQYRQLYPSGRIIFIMTAKTPGHIMHYDRYKDVLITHFTATGPRISRDFLAAACKEYLWLPGVRCFICGPPLEFIEDLSEHVIKIGFAPSSIRTERYF